MKAIKYIGILAASIIIFNSCTKQVAGPTGPTGAQGAQGPSASYTVYIDSIAPTAWANPSNGLYTAVIDKLQALSLPSTDIVQVYCTPFYSSLSTWSQFPAFNILSATDIIDCSYTVYQMTVQYNYSAAPTAMLYIKIIVINQP